MSTFMERAKAKASALADKSKAALDAAKERIDDISKPCVQCGSKNGVLRYDCNQCNTQKFCFKCTDYCSVSHNLVPVFSTREKAVIMKDSAAEKSQELYRKALLKWKNRKNAADISADATAAAGGESLSEGAEGTDGTETTPSAVQASIAAASEDPNRTKIDEYTTKSVCRLCFRSSVQTLDLNRNYDIVGPYDNDINATIIAVHGGGNSRGSLRRMAEQLIAYKIRTILIDLPGHGGRMDEALNLETAIDAVHTAATTLMQQATANDSKAGLLLLMGVGLGGYVCMEYLGRASPKKFDGAVIVNAGMGVGRDEATLMSRAALSLATSASQALGAKTVTQAALRELKKTATLMKDEIHENLIDTGLYFHSTVEQLNTVKSVATKASLNRFFAPVMYMDGSKDYHDMVDTYTKISVDNELRTFRRGGDAEDADGAANDDDTAEGGLIILSRSIQYPQGNHHFLHDTRFADESYADIAVFVQQLVDRAQLVERNPNLVLSTEELEELLKKQREAAEAAAAAAAEAAANAKPIGASLMEKAKQLSASIRKTDGNAASADASSGLNGASSTTATAASSVDNEEYPEVISNSRASTASVAVPFVAAAAAAEEEYAAPAPAEPTVVAVEEEETPAAAAPAPVEEETEAPAADAQQVEEEVASPAEEEEVAAEGSSPATKGKGKKGKKGGRN